MYRGSYTAGVMFASLAAGPAFLGGLAIAAWANAEPDTYQFVAIDGAALSALPFVALVVIIGLIISLIPNIIGAWLLHGLGIGNVAARLPVMWALTGAGLAGIPTAVISGEGPEAAFLTTAFAITGATCALVSNRFVHWN